MQVTIQLDTEEIRALCEHLCSELKCDLPAELGHLPEEDMRSLKSAGAPFVGFECSKALKRRVRLASRATGQSMSQFARAAVSEWFAAHPTLESQLASIKAFRAEGGSATTRTA